MLDYTSCNGLTLEIVLLLSSAIVVLTLRRSHRKEEGNNAMSMLEQDETMCLGRKGGSEAGGREGGSERAAKMPVHTIY